MKYGCIVVYKSIEMGYKMPLNGPISIYFKLKYTIFASICSILGLFEAKMGVKTSINGPISVRIKQHTSTIAYFSICKTNGFQTSK